MNKSSLFLLVFILLPLAFTSVQAQGWQNSFAHANGNEEDNLYGQGAIETSDNIFVNLVHLSVTESEPFPVNFFLRLDEEGNGLDSEVLEDFHARELKPLPSGGSIVYGFSLENDTAKIAIQKYDAAFQLEWFQTYRAFELPIAIDQLQWIHDVTELQDGSLFAVANTTNHSSPDGHYVFKTDPQGNLLWEKNIGFNPWASGQKEVYTLANNEIALTINGSFEELMKLDSDGNIIYYSDLGNMNALPIAAFVPHPDNGGIYSRGSGQTLRRIDTEGSIIWEETENTDGGKDREMIRTIDNYFVMTGSIDDDGPSSDDAITLKKIDENNNLIWIRKYKVALHNHGHHVITTSDGGYLIQGRTYQDGIWKTTIIKTDSQGSVNGKFISGQVSIDENENCELDPSENNLKNYTIFAEGLNSYYATADQNGHFQIDVDTGIYTLYAFPYSNYWDVCDNAQPILAYAGNDTDGISFSAQAITDCPYLEVDVSIARFRPCISNPVFVHYNNFGGTVTAEEATIDVAFDDLITVDSASIPIISEMDNVYSFNLGDISIETQGSFIVYTSFPCDSTTNLVGLTPCVEAHIYPDDLCLDTLNLWSGASVEVGANCNLDSLRFTITNNGNNDMNEQLEFIVIEDEVLLREDNFQLNQGASTEIAVPANGATYRLEADQVAFHPGMSMPSVAVEGCGESTSGIFSTGFINAFPQDDGNPFIDIECSEIVNSYDPNDKQGFPLGRTAENIIETNTDIEYLIRFQNTGTDTAYNVVINDILSPYLDLTTVRPGASSHPYQYKMLNDGTLSFEFDNIYLPDSAANLTASQGFISFKVAQQMDNPIGTVIYNTAAIFFDANAAVITNTTKHTIGEDLILAIHDQPTSILANIDVFPNPFIETATFQLKGLPLSNLTFRLYDLNGRLLRTDQFHGTTYEFQRARLISGMYLYRIEQEGQLIGSGKLIMK